jgi:integrase
MSRSIRDAGLEKAAARARLAPGLKHWRLLEVGLHLGYRRGRDGGGSWIARRIASGKYVEHRLGRSDDLVDADGVTILSFADAQSKARDWWLAAGRAAIGLPPVESGPYTVERALRDYFADRLRRSSTDLRIDRGAAALHILPALGRVPIAELTTARLRSWLGSLAQAPKLRRRNRNVAERKLITVDPEDIEGMRQRRLTANRRWAILRGALNLAFADGRIGSDAVWRRLKPLPIANAPVVRFLDNDASRRLINACAADFRKLVSAALLTGCRYQELARMQCCDFNAHNTTVTVLQKPRHIALTSEGAAFFAQQVAGRADGALMFLRDDGKPWRDSNQRRPMLDACARAKIDPPINFHGLRHTFASALVMNAGAS